MQIPSIDKLDILAVDVLLSIDEFLIDQKIVKSILETYKLVCRSRNIQGLKISEMPITDDMKLRMGYECLCFSIFLATLQSTKYLAEKKWFTTHPDKILIQQFNRALETALIVFCEKTMMIELRDIKFIATGPEPKFVLGAHLDPLDRLEEYGEAFIKNHGRELGIFSNWVGKALDAPNYPLFETIGSMFGKQLIKMSNDAVTIVSTQGTNSHIYNYNQNNSQEQLYTALEGCNFVMVKDFIVQNLGDIVIPDELAVLLGSFIANPCTQTAIRLIKYDPKYFELFDYRYDNNLTKL